MTAVEAWAAKAISASRPPGPSAFQRRHQSRLTPRSAPENLGPAVNTAADEYHPTLTRDGVLYFVRNDFRERVGDFYRIDARSVGLR